MQPSFKTSIDETFVKVRYWQWTFTFMVVNQMEKQEDEEEEAEEEDVAAIQIISVDNLQKQIESGI